MGHYYVVSYPKSGATWFRTLMYGLFNGQPESSRDVQMFYPELPTEIDIVKKNIKEKKSLAFIKSHYAYNSKLEFLKNCDAVIYISRNPMNVMLSKLDHYKYEGVDWVSKENGFAKFCEEFISQANIPATDKKENTHGGWSYHVASWLNADLNIPLIHIKYEDLVEDGLSVLQQLNKEFSWDVNEDSMKTALEVASFKSLRDLEEKELRNDIRGMFYSEKRKKSFLANNDNRFVRKGGKRDAYLELPTETILRLKVKFFKGMELAGYR